MCRFRRDLVFKPVASKAFNKKHPKLVRHRYVPFKGKVIRRINIVSLDPFGYSVQDTAIVPQNLMLKAGDLLHVKTQSFTIRNLLLIHENQLFDSLRFKESERLVRSQDYVRDVVFTPIPLKNQKIRLM